MARLPRLVLAGHAHALLLSGLPGRPLFVDETDRRSFLDILLACARAEHCRLHAYAMLEAEVRLVATPEAVPHLAGFVQALGRRYVSAHHRRHHGHGALWSGRFRSAVLEPGSKLLDALLWVDGASPDPSFTSVAHRTGGGPWPGLSDPPVYWNLGNTPFEREAAYLGLLSEGLAREREQTLVQAIKGGWVAGGSAFSAEAAARSARPAIPRKAGRPRSKAD